MVILLGEFGKFVSLERWHPVHIKDGIIPALVCLFQSEEVAHGRDNNEVLAIFGEFIPSGLFALFLRLIIGERFGDRFSCRRFLAYYHRISHFASKLVFHFVCYIIGITFISVL